MKRKILILAAGLTTLTAFAGLGGCATTKEIEALRKEVHAANIQARRAREEALAASQMAGKAKAEAEKARALAEATDSRLDRLSK